MLVVVVFDGGVVLHDERLLDELQRHRGFANSTIAHYHNLEEAYLKQAVLVNKKNNDIICTTIHNEKNIETESRRTT